MRKWSLMAIACIIALVLLERVSAHECWGGHGHGCGHGWGWHRPPERHVFHAEMRLPSGFRVVFHSLEARTLEGAFRAVQSRMNEMAEREQIPEGREYAVTVYWRGRYYLRYLVPAGVRIEQGVGI